MTKIKLISKLTENIHEYSPYTAHFTLKHKKKHSWSVAHNLLTEIVALVALQSQVTRCHELWLRFLQMRSSTRRVA